MSAASPAAGRGATTAAGLAALLLAAACGAEEAPRLDVAVSPTPAAVGTAQVRVRLPDGAETSPDALVVVTARPPGDAAAPAVVDTAAAVRAGLWVVEAFPFDRAGEWTLEASARLPDGRTVRGTHDILVVGGGGG